MAQAPLAFCRLGARRWTLPRKDTEMVSALEKSGHKRIVTAEPPKPNAKRTVESRQPQQPFVTACELLRHKPGDPILHLLPPEILRIVLSYLPFSSLFLLAGSSRHLRNVITSDRTNFSKVDFTCGLRPPRAAALKAVAKWGRSRIRMLDLGRAHGLDDPGMEPFFAQLCDGVTALRIASSHRLSSSTFLTIPKIMRSLRALVLREMPRVDNKSVNMIFAMCHQLEELDLSECNSLTDSAFSELSKWTAKRESGTPAIRAFTLSGIESLTDVSVKCIVAASGVHLKVLRISRTRATPRSLLELAGAPNLTILDVSGCPLGGHASVRLSDALVVMLSSTPALAEFWCAGVPDLDDTALQYIAASAPDLQVLDIGRCAGVTFGGLQHVGQACRALKHVNISWCPGVGSSMDLVLGAVGGPELETLDISNCSGVSDATLSLVALKCPSLTRLRIAGCTKVTSSGVRSLLSKRGIPFASLDLDGCEGVSREAVQQIVTTWPGCAVRAGLGGMDAKVKVRRT
ncbi:RNI-like protein [Gonapodya prolifera JEL478]|uniref:RNI-like protein n=1 Tax=Gonapodya prolifera (strain JEL478) TaxID=1344416 RepID=A0A139AXN6_GONPJ|nr:RNI-like protein [Gonapodya prolifera JEL478]|eukprot:KXS21480.1 RNI-like protein [Gonapodya prolifera JEL478]